jgi:capsular exopolysaccharide synthesis family protein
MELRQYFDVLRKYWRLIALAAVLATLSAFGASYVTSPVYESSLILQVDYGADPRNDSYSALLTGERTAKTYVEQLKSTVVLREAVQVLGNPRTVKQVQDATLVTQLRDTQLIQVTTEDTNPALAQALATRIAAVFINLLDAKQQARYASGLSDLDSQISELERSINVTQAAIAALTEGASTKTPGQTTMTGPELARLQTNLTTYTTRYQTLVSSAEEFRLASARYSDRVSVFAPAEMPLAPTKPKIPLNTALGLVVGLMLGVGCAFLIEYLDDTLKTDADVNQALGLSLLGAISRIADLKSPADGLVTAQDSHSPVAEAYRVLRSNLQFSLVANPGASVLVTSAGPGEGKTTTLTNLGIVLAQSGKRILLVDADLRRPAIHRFFGLANDRGLTNLILDESLPASSLLLPTLVPGLRILPSGPIPPNPAEILGTPRMGQIMDELTKDADIVLYDSPPVLVVTDPTLLAARIAGTILVTDAGRTRRGAALRAKEALGRANAHILGVVLNRLEPKGNEGYYYYYYGDGKRRKKRGQAEQSAQAAQA